MPFSEMADTVGLKSILVAYDFSDISRKPLHHAISIARHFRAKLYVVYVVSSIGYKMAGPEAQQLAYEASLKDARRLEDELFDSGSLVRLEYEFIIREGDVWNCLQTAIREKQIDGVVVGTHARRGVGRLLRGSIAEQVFRQADCPVLIVGPGAREHSLVDVEGTAPTFLFATDFSAASLCALPYATAFAHHFGAKLIVLRVLPAAPVPESFHWSTTGDLTDMRKQDELASQSLFQQLVVPRVPATIELQFMVKFGNPSEQILQASHFLKPDLVVLGLKPTNRAESVSHLPWTVTHEIVNGANCPVLTFEGGSH